MDIGEEGPHQSTSGKQRHNKKQVQATTNAEEKPHLVDDEAQPGTAFILTRWVDG
jgi:hypothetical protein